LQDISFGDLGGTIFIIDTKWCVLNAILYNVEIFIY